MIVRVRLYLSGFAAFLLGIPLTEKAFSQTGDIIISSLNLADAIADSAGQS